MESSREPSQTQTSRAYLKISPWRICFSYTHFVLQLSPPFPGFRIESGTRSQKKQTWILESDPAWTQGLLLLTVILDMEPHSDPWVFHQANEGGQYPSKGNRAEQTWVVSQTLSEFPGLGDPWVQIITLPLSTCVTLTCYLTSSGLSFFFYFSFLLFFLSLLSFFFFYNIEMIIVPTS